MTVTDSDDYELMPSNELDDLRHEVSLLKKGSLMEGDKARMLMESMDKLSASINRLITILDDAQKDIIDEYQQSKPAEKLGQLLDQNEMIARALIAISDNLNGTTSAPKNVAQQQSSPQQQYSDQQYQDSPYSNNLAMPPQNASNGNPRSILSSQATSPNGQPMQAMNQQPMQFGPPVYMSPQSMQSMNPQPMQSMNSQQMQPMNPQPTQFGPASMNQQSMQFGQPGSMGQQPMQFGPPMQSMNQQPMQFGPPGSMSPQSMQFGPPGSMGQQPMQFGQQGLMDPSMGSMDDLPPMDNMPPLDSPSPNIPKKKFLGIM